jgi:hypothetical protein
VAALFCRMTPYAEVGAASLSHFPPRRLRWIVEGEVDGTDAADRDPLPARCHQSADASRFHSSGSPALRKPLSTGGRFGVCAIIHFTVSLGLRRRASVFGQRTNDGFALPVRPVSAPSANDRYLRIAAVPVSWRRSAASAFRPKQRKMVLKELPRVRAGYGATFASRLRSSR